MIIQVYTLIIIGIYILGIIRLTERKQLTTWDLLVIMLYVPIFGRIFNFW